MNLKKTEWSITNLWPLENVWSIYRGSTLPQFIIAEMSLWGINSVSGWCWDKITFTWNKVSSDVWLLTHKLKPVTDFFKLWQIKFPQTSQWWVPKHIFSQWMPVKGVLKLYSIIGCRGTATQDLHIKLKTGEIKLQLLRCSLHEQSCLSLLGYLKEFGSSFPTSSIVAQHIQQLPGPFRLTHTDCMQSAAILFLVNIYSLLCGMVALSSDSWQICNAFKAKLIYKTSIFDLLISNQ